MTYFTRALAMAKFEEFALSQGLHSHALLRAANLPLDYQDNPDALIPYQRFARLLELCVEASGNPLFGLQYGLYQGVNIFGSLLYLIRNAQNVEEALTDLSRYFHVHDNASGVLTERDGKHAYLIYVPIDDNLPGQTQISELAMGVGHQLMRTLLGSRWLPDALTFKHAPLATPARYRRALGTLPRFNGSSYAWMFDAKLLDVPLSDADKALHQLMRQHLNNLSKLTSVELTDYIRRLLRSFLPSGRVTVEYIADFMQMSPRSLQRRLAEVGSSFQDLLDETRQSMAEHYLNESEVNLRQLSELLGYSDQSAFSRAFHRWHGMSPRQWMKTRITP